MTERQWNVKCGLWGWQGSRGIGQLLTAIITRESSVMAIKPITIRTSDDFPSAMVSTDSRGGWGPTQGYRTDTKRQEMLSRKDSEYW